MIPEGGPGTRRGGRRPAQGALQRRVWAGLRGHARAWAGLGGPGRDWAGLGRSGRAWAGLGGPGRAWAGLRRPGRAWAGQGGRGRASAGLGGPGRAWGRPRSRPRSRAARKRCRTGRDPSRRARGASVRDAQDRRAAAGDHGTFMGWRDLRSQELPLRKRLCMLCPLTFCRICGMRGILQNVRGVWLGRVSAKSAVLPCAKISRIREIRRIRRICGRFSPRRGPPRQVASANKTCDAQCSYVAGPVLAGSVLRRNCVDFVTFGLIRLSLR